MPKTYVSHQIAAQDIPRAVGAQNDVVRQAKFCLGIPLKGDSDIEPAEMIAAAYAKSFSLALSTELGLKVCADGEVVTTATVTLDELAAGWTIVGVHLNVVARLPRMSQGRFIDATVRAKTNCLISRSLRANISMNAKLEK